MCGSLSPASFICSFASSPITVWCNRTWFSTEPREYFTAPFEVAATSTASLIAMPSDPVESGCASMIALPACVGGDGDGITSAPNVSMKVRRYGFCSDEAFTKKTWHPMPKNGQASEGAEPHVPAAVSVEMDLVPACMVDHAWT